MRWLLARTWALLVVAMVSAIAGCGPDATASFRPTSSTTTPSSPDSSTNTVSRPTAHDAPSPPGFAAGWSSAGRLADARVGHTATLLADGRVLVAGGLDIDGAAAEGVEVKAFTSSEVFDPATKEWTVTGSMTLGRAFHTATLLRDGTVLVAGGGEANETAATSAELYDPSTGRWTAVGSMAESRLGHTALLLPSGAVLVVGGHGLGSDPIPLASAERYDATRRTWSDAPSPVAATFGQAGIGLDDGRALLIVGGAKESATTWIYEPGRDAWTESGAMGQPRHGFPLALLRDGSVLAPGGGSGMFDGVLAAAQRFDPVSGTWRDAGSMALQRQSFTATTLADGRVVAIGGGPGDAEGPRSAEIYDPDSGTWSSIGSMADPRFGHSATRLRDGSILVVGGYRGADNSALATSERLIPGTP